MKSAVCLEKRAYGERLASEMIGHNQFREAFSGHHNIQFLLLLMRSASEEGVLVVGAKALQKRLGLETAFLHPGFLRACRRHGVNKFQVETIGTNESFGNRTSFSFEG